MASAQDLEFRAITKRYGPVVALRDIHLTIHAGEFFTLLGPSGSGKTTLLKIIAGFETPTEGSIRLGDTDLTRIPVARRNIGMVFQNYALFPHMSVAGNVAFGLEMRRRPRAEIDTRVREALALVGLTGMEARYPRELSGGQQQRTALARALVFDPDILLMDEPLGALDKNLRQNIQLELKNLHRRLAVTIVYVTHDQEEAMHLSDRILVLDEGGVVQVGSPEELYHTPANRFVAGFVGECNLFPGDRTGGYISVRPEKLRVGRDAEGCDLTVPAELSEVIFVGSGYKLLLRSGKLDLIAMVDRPPEVAIHEAVTVGFRASDGYLVQD